MHIRHISLATIACAAVLASCDGPTTVDQTLSASSPAFARTNDPNAPSGLTATPVIPSQINLAWTDNSHNETSFQIYRSAGSASGFALLISVAANVTAYSDVDLQPVNEHCYYVQAITKTRVLGASIPACARPPVKPPAASNAAVISQGGVVNITWTDNSIIESGFRIEAAGSSAGPWTPAEPFGGVVGADVTSAQRSASTEAEVCFHIVAFNDFGDAAPSNAACTTPLAAPSLAATGEGQYDREIKLTWSDNSTEEWYEISRSISEGVWQVLATASANTIEYLDAGLSVGTPYSYRVRALKAAGSSEYSNVATTSAVSGRPRTPAVYAYAYTYDYGYGPVYEIDVYWDIPQGYSEGASSVTGWRVERSLDPFTTWANVDPTNPNTSGYYYDTDLSLYVTVCYQVTALSPFGDSDPGSGGNSCATPTDYDPCWYCYGANAAGVNGLGSLAARPTPLLNFGKSKQGAGRAGAVKGSKRATAPSTSRMRRSR